MLLVAGDKAGQWVTWYRKADRLSDGRLRCRYEWAMPDVAFRDRDVAVTGTRLSESTAANSPGRAMPVRWVITERVGVEPAVNGTDLTVRALGRMVGPSRIFTLGVTGMSHAGRRAG